MTDLVTLPYLNPRGVYDPTIWYDPNDQITYNGVPYFCRVGIINGQPITPGSDPTVWQLLNEPGAQGIKGDKGDPGEQGPRGRDGVAGASGAGYRVRGNWDPAVAYSAGDSVTYLNSGATYSVVWFAIQDNTNVVPGTNAGVWAAGIKGDTGDVTPAAQAAAAAALASQDAAAGSATAAAGSATTALGYKNSASASASAALGSQQTASTAASTAVGAQGSASASASAALGSQQTASAAATAALGYQQTASAAATAALGSQNAAAASAALANQAALRSAKPNMLFNGSAEFGSLGWTGGIFSTFQNYIGTYFQYAPVLAGVTVGPEFSSFIPMDVGVTLTLQGLLYSQGMTAGKAAMDVECYNSAQQVIGDIARVELASGQNWTFVANAGTTPANTAYIRVRKYADGSPTGSTYAFAFQRIKLEQNSTYSLYSQEANWQSFGASPPSRLSPIFQAIQAFGKVQALNTPNLLVNGSGELGDYGWSGGQWLSQNGASGQGYQFVNKIALSSTTYFVDASIPVPIASGIPLCISAEIVNNATTGNVYAGVDAYTSAGVFISSVCVTQAVLPGNVASGAPSLAGYAQVWGTGVTPAGTGYVVVKKAFDTTPNGAANSVRFRRMKLEYGSTPSLYSYEASVPLLASGSANNPNLLQNGSGEQGALGWGLNANFSVVTDTTGGLGPIFFNSAVLSNITTNCNSPSASVGAGRAVTAAIDLVNYATSGSVVLSLAAFNSSGTAIGNVATALVLNNSGLARYTLSGTTPANTAYVVVYVNFTGVTTASTFSIVWRRLKIEIGTTPTPYSHEATIAALNATAAAQATTITNLQAQVTAAKAASVQLVSSGSLVGVTVANIALPAGFTHFTLEVDNFKGTDATSRSLFLQFADASGVNIGGATSYNWMITSQIASTQTQTIQSTIGTAAATITGGLANGSLQYANAIIEIHDPKNTGRLRSANATLTSRLTDSVFRTGVCGIECVTTIAAQSILLFLDNQSAMTQGTWRLYGKP
jgi:hypothetical protein